MDIYLSLLAISTCILLAMIFNILTRENSDIIDIHRLYFGKYLGGALTLAASILLFYLCINDLPNIRRDFTNMDVSTVGNMGCITCLPAHYLLHGFRWISCDYWNCLFWGHASLAARICLTLSVKVWAP